MFRLIVVLFQYSVRFDRFVTYVLFLALLSNQEFGVVVLLAGFSVSS